MALPRGALGLSAVCDCGISCSYSLTIFKPVCFMKKRVCVAGPTGVEMLDLFAPVFSSMYC